MPVQDDIRTRADEIAQRAVALRSERGFNCAQAVACALAPEVGADFEQAYLLAEGFGAGMGDHRWTCGAISGAIMAIGCERSAGTAEAGTTKFATYALATEILEAFQERNGSTLCGELKGIGRDHGPLRSCPGCIADAAEIACEIIGALRAGERA